MALLLRTLTLPRPMTFIRTMAAASKKAGGGKGPTKKKIFDVETDANKLVTHCCGLNYKLEGEEVKLKEDSEYPKWLFEMDIKRPKPEAEMMENKNSFEYFEKLTEEYKFRKRRVAKQRRKLHVHGRFKLSE